MKISFDPQKQSPPRTGSMYLFGQLIAPGVNEVPDGVGSKPEFQEMIASGILTITEAEPPASPLITLTITEAEPLIQAEIDPDTLQRWYDADDRKGIHEAIASRLDDL